jgi:hypothetical protein
MMRQLLLVSALLALWAVWPDAPSVSARRVAAHVQTCTETVNDPTPATITCTFSAGNTVILSSSFDGGTPPPVWASSTGETIDFSYVELFPFQASSGLTVAVVCNVGGGSETFTLTLTGLTAGEMRAVEYSGLPDTSCVTDTEENNASTDDPATPTLTVTSGAMLVGFLAILSGTGAPAPADGETERFEDVFIFLTQGQDKRVTATDNVAWSTSSAQDWAYIALALEEPGGGPTFPFGIINVLLKGGGLAMLLVVMGGLAVIRRRDSGGRS